MIKQRIITYGLLALVLLLGYNLLLSWWNGASWSPVQSIHRVPKKTVAIAPEAPRKGEKVVTLPNIPLQVIEGSKGPSSAPEGHYTIGRWEIPECPKGGIVVGGVDKVTGKPSLTFTANGQGIAEMGRSKYLTLWGEAAIDSEATKKYSLKLEFEMDAWRVGPLWTRIRVGAYYEQNTYKDLVKENDSGVYGGVGIGVGL